MSSEWRDTEIGELELPPSILKALADEDLDTAGDVLDHLDSGKPIEGIGPAKAAQIRKAIAALSGDEPGDDEDAEGKPSGPKGSARYFTVVHDGVGIYKKGDEITGEDLVDHTGKSVDIKRLVKLGAILEHPAPADEG